MLINSFLLAAATLLLAPQQTPTDQLKSEQPKQTSPTGQPQPLATSASTANRPIQVLPSHLTKPIKIGETAADERSAAALEKVGDINLANIPFRQALTRLGEQFDVNIALDAQAITILSLNDQEPVSVKLRQVSLRSALQIICEPRDLTAIVREGIVLVTDKLTGTSSLKTFIYPLADLALVVHGDRCYHVGAGYVQLIQDIIEPDSWDANGGDGRIQYHQETYSLVITQTESVQRQIAALLQQLRHTIHITDEIARWRGQGSLAAVYSKTYIDPNAQIKLDANPAANTDEKTTKVIPTTEERRRLADTIEASLWKPIQIGKLASEETTNAVLAKRTDIKINNLPFIIAIETLAAKLRLKVVWDVSLLDNLPSGVSLDRRQITLEEALTNLTADTEIKFHVLDRNTICLTMATEPSITKVYPAFDFLARSDNEQVVFQHLQQVLQAEAEAGDDRRVSAIASLGLIIITGEPGFHTRIEQLLQGIRQMYRQTEKGLAQLQLDKLPLSPRQLERSTELPISAETIAALKQHIMAQQDKLATNILDSLEKRLKVAEAEAKESRRLAEKAIEMLLRYQQEQKTPTQQSVPAAKSP